MCLISIVHDKLQAFCSLRQQRFDFDWLVNGNVDVEATADRVDGAYIVFYSSITMNSFTVHAAELYLCSRKPFANSFTHTDTFTLPVHMRYQPAADDSSLSCIFPTQTKIRPLRLHSCHHISTTCASAVLGRRNSKVVRTHTRAMHVPAVKTLRLHPSAAQ